MKENTNTTETKQKNNKELQVENTANIQTEDTVKSETESNSNSVYQIYDRMFKKILTLSPGAVICLINGLFQTNYPPNSSITYNWTEHYDDDLHRTLADTILTINGVHTYHIEAQMSKDEEIEFRVFDYGYKHALTTRGGTDILRFPEPQIIFLYNEKNLPDEKIIYLDFGTQGIFPYRVPVYKLLEHSLQELDEKKMIILIPFFLLKLRRQMEKSRSTENINALQSLIFDDILKLLQKNVDAGVITSADSNRLKNLIQRLYEHLYADYEECEKEGLNAMMNRGLVLEADILEAEITKRVTEKVTQEVTTRTLVEQVCKKMRKNRSIPEIADALEEDDEKIRIIYNTAMQFAPEYKTEDIAAVLLNT